MKQRPSWGKTVLCERNELKGQICPEEFTNTSETKRPPKPTTPLAPGSAMKKCPISNRNERNERKRQPTRLTMSHVPSLHGSMRDGSSALARSVPLKAGLPQSARPSEALAPTQRAVTFRSLQAGWRPRPGSPRASRVCFCVVHTESKRKYGHRT